MVNFASSQGCNQMCLARHGVFTCVGWQITLSDRIWQVTLCSYDVDVT